MDIKALIGQTFGRLTIIDTAPEKGKYHALCQCSCGKQKAINAYDIVSGRTQSCGCLQKEKASEARLEDLTGQRFGRLVVIRRVEDYISPKGAPAPRWECLCDCGNKTIVSSGLLKNGNVSSCGCYYREVQAQLDILKPKDMLDKRFGSLTVVAFAGTKKNLAYWKCVCDCGKEVIVRGSALRNGTTKSCGSYSEKHPAGGRSLKHGDYNKSLYKVWTGIKQRCCNPHCKEYDAYGGRGITVCDEWRDNYLAFREWAISAGYVAQKGDNGYNILSIDRIDVNGNYEPSNCRWASNDEQQRNKRNNQYITYKGETLVVGDMGKKYGIDGSIIKRRLEQGWSVEQAIETPVKKKKETVADD